MFEAFSQESGYSLSTRKTGTCMAYQLTSALNITIIKNLYILKEPVKKVLGKHRKYVKGITRRG